MSSNIHSASHKEVFERAIRRAIDNGWDTNGVGNWRVISADDFYGNDRMVFESFIGEEVNYQESVNDIIFSHDFAKALWGYFYPASYASDPNWVNSFDKEKIGKDAWQYHLQQMVIADDPIKYLGENI